jgi:type IV pilus assembly protein PilM
MAKRLTSVLGIDIGSETIKVCEIRSQGREPVVTAMGLIATPEGSVDHTGIFNPEAVAAAIKQVLSNSAATVQPAVVTITGQASVLVRTLEVPKMNPTELKEHMQWEINRNIPFAESTVVSDFKPLGNDDPNSPNMDVVMAISPQSSIDTLVTCLKKAGRQPAGIDVEPLSLARTLQKNYDDLYPTSTVCLVDIGAKTTSINMYLGAKLLMPRQVPLGGELFTKAIADALAIGMGEAETRKRDRFEIPESAAVVQATPFGTVGSTQEFQPYNPFSDEPLPAFAPEQPTQMGYGGAAAFDPMADFNTPLESAEPVAPAEPDLTPAPAEPDITPAVQDVEAARLFAAVAPVLEEFVAEVRRSVDYFQSRGGHLDVVLLCGGGSKMRGLAQYMSKSLGLTCDNYDPLRRLNVNARKLPPEFTDEHRAEFAVALGNGLYIFFD